MFCIQIVDRQNPEAHVPKSMIPATGFARIPLGKSIFSDSFLLDLAGKHTRTWKQYSGQKTIVHGNGEIRKVPFAGLPREMRRTRAGN